VFVEWAIHSSLWIPFIIAASSSSNFEIRSNLPSSIRHYGNKNDDDDEYSWLPAIVSQGLRSSSTGSGPSTSRRRDSSSMMASRSTRTEAPISYGVRSAEPQLPTYSWENPFAGVDLSRVNGRAAVPEEVRELVQSHASQKMLADDEGPPMVDDLEPSSDFEPQDDTLPQNETFGDYPVIYRYFGGSRARFRSCDSIPFILLGPSVDHWKTAGQTLSSRGFSVMACERVNEVDDGQSTMILAVLDALRWNRAILVGCDKESMFAIQAAMALSPDRIAGLVLCGDLSSAESIINRATNEGSSLAIDRFLQENLECPYTILWDGDGPTRNKESSEGLSSHRRLILGGGSAPHRRQPEHFAWALTRFVEENVFPPVLVAEPTGPQLRSAGESKKFSLPFGLDDFIAPESLLVIGRVIATALLLTSFGKVFLYQYENVHQGMATFQSYAKLLQSWPKRLLFAMGGIATRQKGKPDDTDSVEADLLSTVEELHEPLNGEVSPGENEEVQAESETDDEAATDAEKGVDDEVLDPPTSTFINPYEGWHFRDHVIA
jgi:hypothetical protein